MALTDPLWLVALKIGAVFFLVFLNGFFVAAEFALVKVRTTQLAAAERAGDRRARVAQHLVGHLDAYLSAAQLGITLASLALGWVGEPAVAMLIAPLVAAAGVENPAVLHGISFTVAFAAITFLHIVLGEQAPKSLAIRRAQDTALFAARAMAVFYRVFQPAIWVLNTASLRLLRAFGVSPPSEGTAIHSEEELRLLLADAGAGRPSPLGRDILLNALDLRRREVREIMVPRPRIVVLNASQSLDANLRVAWESGYTRFPLAERGDLDRVVGMIHLKDLLRLAAREDGKADVASVKRELLLVPEGMVAEELLSRMLQKRTHLALVIDEHGGTVGLVALEDLLEEIVGEIQDEFDEESTPIRRVADGTFLVDGTAPLYQVADAIGVPLASRDVSTIGGLIVEKLGRIPAPGERVDLPGHVATVRSADRKRVKSLLIERGRAAPGA